MVENTVFYHPSYPQHLMKIAFLIQDISTEGGTERTTCCLAQELARRGHEVSVVSVFRNEPQPYYTAVGVAFIYLTHEAYTLRETVLARIKKAWRQRTLVRSCKVLQEADCIICQKIAASFMAWSAGFGHKSVACEHYRYTMYNAAIRRLRKRLYCHMSAVVTLTENDQKAFERSGLRNVFCIPNMVSISPLPYHGENSKRIVSVGRLTSQKGYDLLLQSIALIADKMGDFYIDIYGEGDDRPALEAQCRRLGLNERVHFPGYCTQIESIYAESAFYVMSSRFEGFPMVLLEAASCGLPIVSFDCPEGPAILLRNGGGILAERENVPALGQAILTMIQNPALRDKSHSESAAIIAPYLPSKIGKQWEELFKNLSK